MVTSPAAPVPEGGRTCRGAAWKRWATDPVLGRILLWKLGFFALALGVLWLRPGIHRTAYFSNLSWPRNQAPVFASHFATWDSAHYLLLSEAGYSAGTPSCAFYPLWPALMQAAAKLTGWHPVLSGLVLANLFSLVGLRLFHRFVEVRLDRPAADAALWTLLAAPGAFFLQLIYSEALCLCLLMGLCLALHYERTAWSLVLGVLLTLTRPVGLYALVPWAWVLWQRRTAWRGWWPLAAPVLGFGLYLGWMHWMTGNPWEGFAAQRNWPVNSLGNVVDLPKFLREFTGFSGFHDYRGSLLDRLVFLGFAATLPWCWKRDREWFLWACLLGVLPALISSFVSFTRYGLLAFPAWIAIGCWVKARAWRNWFWFASANLQLWLLIRHLRFAWAG